MTKNHGSTNAADRPSRWWYAPDVVLVGGLALAYAVFFVALHLAAYRSGFGRDPSGRLAVFVLAVVVLIVVLLPVSAIRMVRTWRRYIADKPRLWGLRRAAVLGIALYLVVPFTRSGWLSTMTNIR